MAAVRCAAACSSTAAVTDAVVSVDDLAGDLVGGLHRTRVRSGLLTRTAAGSDMIAIRLTISACSFWASGEPTPSTWLIPNSVDGSVPASVIIEVRSSGSGSSPPRFTSSCCIIIWPRAPTARRQAERLGADALVVDADRAVDGVLGGQQDRRVGGDPVAQADAVGRDLVHQRLAAVDHARDALADVRRDVGVGQPALQFLPAGVELGQRAPGRRRRWNSPTSRRRARPCSSRSPAPFRRGRRRGANRWPRSRCSRCATRRTCRPEPAAPIRSRTLSSEPANWTATIAMVAWPAAAALGSKSTSVPSACLSCENAVIGGRPRYRPRVRISVMERGS